MSYLQEVLEKQYPIPAKTDSAMWDVLDVIFIENELVTPVLYNEHAIQECIRLCGKGVALKSIADSIGVKLSVFMQFLDAHATISRRLRQAYLYREERVLEALLAACDEGNFSAIKYYLENRGSQWASVQPPELEDDELPRLQIGPPIAT